MYSGKTIHHIGEGPSFVTHSFTGELNDLVIRPNASSHPCCKLLRWCHPSQNPEDDELLKSPSLECTSSYPHRWTWWFQWCWKRRGECSYHDESLSIQFLIRAESVLTNHSNWSGSSSKSTGSIVRVKESNHPLGLITSHLISLIHGCLNEDTSPFLITPMFSMVRILSQQREEWGSSVRSSGRLHKSYQSLQSPPRCHHGVEFCFWFTSTWTPSSVVAVSGAGDNIPVQVVLLGHQHVVSFVWYPYMMTRSRESCQRLLWHFLNYHTLTIKISCDSFGSLFSLFLPILFSPRMQLYYEWVIQFELTIVLTNSLTIVVWEYKWSLVWV